MVIQQRFFFFLMSGMINWLLKCLPLNDLTNPCSSEYNPSCFSTGLRLSDDTITGMLDTESPVMESNGDAFLPDLPVLGQAADWSMDQVAPGPITNILPEDSDASQDAPGQQQEPDQQMNATELGSVEKAVEQFQLASAQLFQEEQPPPPPPPPPQPTEEAEHKTESVESLQANQEMSVEPEAAVQDASQGNKNNCCLIVTYF